MDYRNHHRSSERRPLKPELEQKLWKFVYDNKIAENNFPTLFAAFKEFRRRGGAKEYGVTEIEFHFHSVMIPNLFKTEWLTPRQILATFYKLRLPIRQDLRPILSLMCKGVRARCDKSGCLTKYKFPDENKSPDTSIRKWNPGATNLTTVPIHVETAMWRHIEKHSKDVDAVMIQTLAFWRKMKLREEDRAAVTPDVLVSFFTDRLRHYMFALKMNPVDKIELIDALYLKLSPGQQRWLLRVDGVAVEMNDAHEIVAHRLWRDEEPQVDPTGNFWGLDGYRPLERYVESIDVWEGLDARREAQRQKERDEMLSDPQQFGEFQKWMKQITITVPLPEKIRIPVQRVVYDMIEDLEDREACDGIMEQIREESNDYDFDMPSNSSRMAPKRATSPSQGPDAKVPKISSLYLQ